MVSSTHRPMRHASRRDTLKILLSGLAASGLSGCYDFQPAAPEDAPNPDPPRLVTVTIEYREPAGCTENEDSPCPINESVVFFGSWMRPGQEIILRADPYGWVWRGLAQNVPVNFPPRDYPHYVRVFDPHLRFGPSGGITAERLKIGGQICTRFDRPGTDRESGLMYVDENGLGHSPF